jgi:hypothetical protein
LPLWLEDVEWEWSVLVGHFLSRKVVSRE